MHASWPISSAEGYLEQRNIERNIDIIGSSWAHDSISKSSRFSRLQGANTPKKLFINFFHSFRHLKILVSIYASLFFLFWTPFKNGSVKWSTLPPVRPHQGVVQAFFQVHYLGVLKTWTIRDRAAIGPVGSKRFGGADACNSRKLQNESDGSANRNPGKKFSEWNFWRQEVSIVSIWQWPVHLYIDLLGCKKNSFDWGVCQKICFVECPKQTWWLVASTWSSSRVSPPILELQQRREWRCRARFRNKKRVKPVPATYVHNQIYCTLYYIYIQLHTCQHMTYIDIETLLWQILISFQNSWWKLVVWHCDGMMFQMK